MAFRTFEKAALWAVLAATIAIGVALRFHNSATVPLWLDEAYSAYAADHGFGFLWNVVPRYETHPPVYYSLLRIWGLLSGHGLLARRALGLVCAIAALGVAFRAATMLGLLVGWPETRRRWLVAMTVVLAALHPFSIQMAQQVRPYPVMILVYAVALLAVLRLGIDARDARRLSRGWLVVVAVAEAAILWLHSLGPLFGGSIALALAMLTIRRRMAGRDLALLAATQIAAGLLYLPALSIMLGQAPTWIGSTWLHFVPDRLSDDLGVLYADWHRGAPTVALLAALAGVVLLTLRGAWGARATVALLLVACLPTAASIALSATVSPVFLLRTLSPVTIPGLMLIAAGLSWPGGWRFAALPFFAYLAATELGVARALSVRPPMQDWNGAIDWLAARTRPGDVVWAYPNEGALPLDYALRDRRIGMTVRPIPAAVPAFGRGGYYPTGSRGVVSLYPGQIAALMRTPAATEPPTIWLLRLGAARYDPGDRMVKALLETREPVGRLRLKQIDIVGLRTVQPKRSQASPIAVQTAPRSPSSMQ